MSGDRNDPFRRQFEQMNSDGCQAGIADVKAQRDHLSGDAFMANHLIWRKGYERGWAWQMEREAAS